MRIFKTRLFHRWAYKEGLTDADLCHAIDEIASDLIDADLGGHVFKKRGPSKVEVSAVGREPCSLLDMKIKPFLCTASPKSSKPTSKMMSWQL